MLAANFNTKSATCRKLMGNGQGSLVKTSPAIFALGLVTVSCTSGISDFQTLSLKLFTTHSPLKPLNFTAFHRPLKKLLDLFTWTANVHHPLVNFMHDYEIKHESEDGTRTGSPRRSPQRFRPRGAGAEVLPLGEATLRFGAYFAAAFGADPFGLLPTGAAAGAADFPALARCAGGIAG